MAGTRVNYAYRNLNGAGIWLSSVPTAGLDELKIPNVFEEKDAAVYPIGTKLQLDDRVFRYYKAGGTISYNRAAICSYDCRTRSSVPSYDSSQAAGTTALIVDGASDGVPVADAYAGGYIIIFCASSLGRPIMRIHGNTKAGSTSPYSITLTLEQGTPTAVAANTSCDIFPSRYADCRSAWAGALAGDMYPFVAVPAINMTSGYYGWGQTWGPCFIVSTSTEPGDATYDRTVVFSSDGSIKPCDEAWNNTLSNQFAGYTLATGDGEGSEWIMLMLDC